MAAGWKLALGARKWRVINAEFHLNAWFANFYERNWGGVVFVTNSVANRDVAAARDTDDVAHLNVGDGYAL